MWYILVLLCPMASSALGSQDSIQFSIDYFRERRVPIVCVVNCESDFYWAKEFAKLATNQSIAVSSFKYSPHNNNGSRNELEQCTLQKNAIVGVLLKTTCAHIEDILFNASENMWLDSMHLWLLLNENDHNVTAIVDSITQGDTNSIHGPKVVKVMEQLNISVDADIKMAVRTDPLQYKLFDIFNFGKVQGGSLKLMDAGSWNTLGFSENLNVYKYYRRWDFGQWPMRVISVATIPSKDFKPSFLTSLVPVPGITTITRTSTAILMVITEIHNIRFVHTLADRWINTFKRNDTRVAGSALYFRHQDLTSVLRFEKSYTYKLLFIHPSVTSLETRYYYRIPTTGPGKYENRFLKPLSVGVWQITFCLAVLCTLILVAAARLEQRPSSLQYATFSVIANICQQFFEDESQILRSSAARKLTVFITGLACVLIYNYYTSSVVSWLLNGPPPSINSLEELLESPLKLIYQDVGYTRSWLSNPGSYYYNTRNMEIEDKIRRKILKHKIKTVLKPLEEGIAMVKAGGYVYHTDTNNADLISKTFTSSELCELGSLVSMEKTLLYPGVQLNSPYKEFLTWSLTRLLERGIISCAQRRTTARQLSCEGSSPRAFALGSAAPAFIMLTFGFLISTAVMIIERYIYKIKYRISTLHQV